MFPNLEAEQTRLMHTNEDVAIILGISVQSYEAKKRNGKFKLNEIKILCNLYKRKFDYLFAVSEEIFQSTG